MPIAVLDRPDRLAARVVVADDFDDAGSPQGAGAPAFAEIPVARDAGRLPLGRLAGLATSGAFAFWTSLTCFVC